MSDQTILALAAGVLLAVAIVHDIITAKRDAASRRGRK